MDVILKPTHRTDLQHHIQEAFGQAPFDIYSYRGIYNRSEGGFVLDMRQKMVHLYETGQYTQRDIALLFNCTERVVRKWIGRYARSSVEGLRDISRAPHHRAIKVTETVKGWVAQAMREYPFFGSRRIAHEIQKRYAYTINHLSVSRIMKELRPKKEKVVPDEIIVPEPALIWHMDMTQMRIFKGRKQYIFGVIDACTRQVHYMMNYSKKTAKAARDCLDWALKKADAVPKELWTDNGKMFVSKVFRDYVKKRGIKQVFIEKGSPWQNGKVERQFRTLKEEWIAYRKYGTITSLNESLKEYRRWFNGEREIQKLGYKTPNMLARNYEEL